ncbi:MAG: LysE family translocator [Phenylobacterium sp.]|uniref:LysE family translocator n=1 Tax=Phenylobacterium sp. TaxID=1871053 RepID=UPI0027373004|nr:LysE family translocator [Phenylobacterium sp.]MDP1642869.1 LysE family translocator [Phenylobacterium sp.]MDP3116820.1 LysE family translocator [Phenylobacterium sp.]
MTGYTPQLLGALGLFAFASSITPGPNNAMLMTSGANYGFARTLPHLAGVVLGFTILLLAVGFGLGGLFSAHPTAHTALKALGAAYLLWLAWKIAGAEGMGERAASARPFTFLQAAGFQWVNPKAWTMAVGVAAAYVPQQGGVLDMLIAGLVVFAISIPCAAAWAGSGVALRRLLEEPSALRLFNWTMAALLLASLAPVLMELAQTIAAVVKPA